MNTPMAPMNIPEPKKGGIFDLKVPFGFSRQAAIPPEKNTTGVLIFPREISRGISRMEMYQPNFMKLRACFLRNLP